MKGSLILLITFLTFMSLIWNCASDDSNKMFLKRSVDTLVFNAPYAPHVLDIMLYPNEKEILFSVSFSKTLNSIYHYERGVKKPVDTTDLTSLKKEIDFYFMEDEVIYACSERAIYSINMEGDLLDSARFPEFSDYSSVEYNRSYELQNIIFEDSCILLSPFFGYKLDEEFTEDIAKNWNYKNYAGPYFAKICNYKNDTSISVTFELDSIMSRFIQWSELAAKVPSYDVGIQEILISSKYHNYIYIVDKQELTVKDSFKIYSDFYDDAIKGPTTKFEDRYDNSGPYLGPYIRWVREVDFKGEVHYVVGIRWIHQSDNTNSFIIQLYNQDFKLMEETKFIGNYRSVAYCFILGNELFIPIRSEDAIIYEVFNIF